MKNALENYVFKYGYLRTEKLLIARAHDGETPELRQFFKDCLARLGNYAGYGA